MKAREAKKRREDSTLDNEGGKGENEDGDEDDEVKDNSCGNESHGNNSEYYVVFTFLSEKKKRILCMYTLIS